MPERMRIFLSHKSADKDLAERFKNRLVILGFHDDEVFLAEEIQPGGEWHPAIISALRTSHCLMLLYTDPSHDWDWCLFECGFFAGTKANPDDPNDGGLNMDQPTRYPIICLNAGAGRPAPLNRWQDIGSIERLKELLIGFCIGNAYYEGVDPGIVARPKALDEDVTNLWNDIKQRFPIPPDPGGWEETLKRRRLVIQLDNAAMAAIKGGGDIPSDSKVEISDGAKEIFVNAAEQSNWEHFHNQLDPHQKAWAEALPIVIRMLNSKKTRSPILPLIRSTKVDEVIGVAALFRPAVVQRDQLPAHELRFHIEFVRTPDAAAINTQFEPDVLYHWLMLARNFREGVLHRYEQLLRDARTGVEAALVLTDLQGEMHLTNMELVGRGLQIDRDLKSHCHISIAEAVDGELIKWKDWTDKLVKLHKKLVRDQSAVSDTDRKELTELMREAFKNNIYFSILSTTAYLGRLAMEK